MKSILMLMPYFGDNFEQVLDLDLREAYRDSDGLAELRKESFSDFLKNKYVNMILVDDDLRSDQRFNGDLDFLTLLKNPRVFGFKRIDIVGVNAYLLVKPVLNAAS